MKPQSERGSWKPVYRRRRQSSHLHLVLPSYLMEYIEKVARAHKTSRSYEIGVCVLLRYLNDEG